MGTWIQRAPMPTPPPRPAVHCCRRHHLRHFRCRRSHGRCGRDLRCGQRHLDPRTAHSHQTGMAGRRPHRPQDLRGRWQNHPHPEEQKAYGHDYHFTSPRQLGNARLGRADLVGAGTHARRTPRWSSRHRLPRPDMGHRRHTMLCEDQRILDRVEVYDVATDTWAQGQPYPAPRRAPP